MHLCGLFAGIFLLYIFSSLAQVNKPSCSSTEGDILNPDRITGKQYDLAHKDNNNNNNNNNNIYDLYRAYTGGSMRHYKDKMKQYIELEVK